MGILRHVPEVAVLELEESTGGGEAQTAFGLA